MEMAKLHLTCLLVFSDHRQHFRNEKRANACIVETRTAVRNNILSIFLTKIKRFGIVFIFFIYIFSLVFYRQQYAC